MRTRTLTTCAAALGLTAALSVSTGAARAADSGAATPSAHPGSASGCHETLAGHDYVVSTDIGFVESYAYNADDTEVTATVIDGAAFGLPDGSVYTEQISVAPVTPGIYMVSWVEPGGYTVSEVQNLHDGAVQIYWTFPDGQGSQVGEQHTGTITCHNKD